VNGIWNIRKRTSLGSGSSASSKAGLRLREAAFKAAERGIWMKHHKII